MVCHNTYMNSTNDTFTQTTTNEGIYRMYRFPNGYQASVICTQHSIGGPQGLWEVAVMDRDGTIVYDTPVTNDVVGNLSDAEMLDVVRFIRTLPARPWGTQRADDRPRPVLWVRP